MLCCPVMPEAITRALLEILGLGHGDYGNGATTRLLHEKLAHEVEAVPDDEILKTWEEWLDPRAYDLSEEMVRIDRMDDDGSRTPGETRLLKALAASFHLLPSPSEEVTDWFLSTTVDSPDPALLKLFVEACTHHLGRGEVRRRLLTLINEGPDHRKEGASKALDCIGE